MQGRGARLAAGLRVSRMSAVDDIAHALSKQLAHKLDALIRHALELHLGHSELNVAELRGRLTRRLPDDFDPSTTYCLDGKPILQTSPWGEPVDLHHLAHTISIGLQYRVIPPAR